MKLCMPWFFQSSSSPLLLLIPLVAVVSNLHVVRADYERVCDYRTRSPQGICGKSLADTLRSICRYYNGRGKRAAAQPDANALDQKQNPWPQDLSIFLPKEKAMSVLDRDKRGGYGRGGITCECCYFRCQLNELTQYCSAINSNLMIKREAHMKQHHPKDAKSAIAVHKSRMDLLEKQAIGREIMRKGAAYFEDFEHQQDLTTHQDQQNDQYYTTWKHTEDE